MDILASRVSVSFMKVRCRMQRAKWVLYRKFDSFEQRESQHTIFEGIAIIKTPGLISLYLSLFLKNIFTELYRHVAIIDNVKALVKC